MGCIGGSLPSLWCIEIAATCLVAVILLVHCWSSASTYTCVKSERSKKCPLSVPGRCETVIFMRKELRYYFASPGSRLCPTYLIHARVRLGPLKKVARVKSQQRHDFSDDRSLFVGSRLFRGLAHCP